ncbi:hypothetical protein DB30_05342 [Enhygromyxa salina]|uniref:Flagellar biosynthesis protein FliR n=1 Tax=Enhygromyxa salina TaxID=215803 RepID=A0A0C2D6X5_9BACT|nr:hypothetical protein [Enhygromyxa salina]KIG15772.1 hypothetical protein DB30_05342 [Enhygromyxa salina]
MNATVVGLALASARVWALLRVQASWRRAIGPTWGWIAAALAVVVAGLALLRGQVGGQVGAPAVDNPYVLGVWVGFELLLGSVVGLAVSLPGWALIGAGEQSEQALGLRGDAGASLSALVVAASLAAGLSLGLHAPLLAGLLGLFDRFALADPGAWLPTLAALPGWLIQHAAGITVLALALATPVLLTRAVLQVCVVSLGRGGGGADLVAALAPGLRLAAALVALGAAWSAYPEAFARGM